MPGKVRLGLVGAGRWGRNYIRTVAALGDAQLVAVASRNSDTAALLPPGCRIADDWRAVTEAPDIDGVIVASPPGTHADILIAAAAAQKAVMVEKPLVMSREDAARIRTALDGRAANILVDHTLMFHPAFQALCREAATLGPLKGVRSSAGNLGPYRQDASVLWDWAPHDLSMCLTLAPGPWRMRGARCAESRVVEGVTAERLVLDLALGSAAANVTVTTLDPRHRSFAAEFQSCTLLFRDFVEQKLVRLPPGVEDPDKGTPVAVDADFPLTLAVRAFAERIRTGNTDRGSLELGLAVVALIADAETMLRRQA
jgi:predicted dehydrogenase